MQVTTKSLSLKVASVGAHRSRHPSITLPQARRQSPTLAITHSHYPTPFIPLHYRVFAFINKLEEYNDTSTPLTLLHCLFSLPDEPFLASRIWVMI
jgi:hypothetical protein